MDEDVRHELRLYADRWPLAARALAEIERLRAGLVDVMAASDSQPCIHAKIASRYLKPAELPPPSPMTHQRIFTSWQNWAKGDNARCSCGGPWPCPQS